MTQIAREYAGKGYSVNISPAPDELPPFLRQFTPDMYVMNDNEQVVIEVKSGKSLARAKDMAKLAKAIEENPGWRFELVVTNPRTQASYQIEFPTLRENDIRDCLTDIDTLLSREEYEAAIMLCWAATEGTLRLIAQREHIRLKSKQPEFAVKKMASMGYLSEDEHQVLRTAIELRSHIMHGGRLHPGDHQVVPQMLEINSRLLAGEEPPLEI